MQNSGTDRYPAVSESQFKAVKFVLGALVAALTRLHIQGEENLPSSGPAIIVTNHLHYFDVAIFGRALPRQAYPLAAEKYERHLLFGPLLRAVGAIFIQRGQVDRKALRRAMNVIADGRWLAVAVEGTRSSTGALAEGKNGVAYFATKLNAPIVPVVTWGSERILRTWLRFRRPEVFVRFGEPFSFAQAGVRAAQLDALTEQIMLKLAALLPREYRGVFRDHPHLSYQP